MIILFDRSAAVCAAFTKHLTKINVELVSRNIQPLDCHVRNYDISKLLERAEWMEKDDDEDKMESGCVICTPGNSLGFMNGGFDKGLINAIHTTSEVLQNYILKVNNSYAPVGRPTSIDLPTILGEKYKNSKIYKQTNLNTIIHVPTMVVPEKIDNSNTIFDAMWNFLITAKDPHVLIPGIGTGYGGVSCEEAAQHILAAVLISKLPIDALSKSLLVAIYMKKDYKKFINDGDLDRLEKCLGREQPMQFSNQPECMWGKLLDSVQLNSQ